MGRNYLFHTCEHVRDCETQRETVTGHPLPYDGKYSQKEVGVGAGVQPVLYQFLLFEFPKLGGSHARQSPSFGSFSTCTFGWYQMVGEGEVEVGEHVHGRKRGKRTRVA